MHYSSYSFSFLKFFCANLDEFQVISEKKNETTTDLRFGLEVVLDRHHVTFAQNL